MSLPGVTLAVQDGNLNLQPGNNEHLMLYLGCSTLGTPNVPVNYSDASTMQTAQGYGELVEALSYHINNAGGPVMAMPMTPDTAGAVGSVTYVGTGVATGSLTVTKAPHVSILITCTTTGTLGNAQFTFKLGAGTTSAPVTSDSSWSSTGYRVPGTYCVVVFTAGTYIATGTADTYLISTLNAITHPTGAGPAVPTTTCSPIDNYNVLVSITASGTVSAGTVQITYSLDNGEANLSLAGTTSAAILVPAAGQYAIPNTGIVLNLTGALVALDTYSFKTATISASTTSLTAAITALTTTYLSQGIYSMVTLLGNFASAAAWATNAATLETAATTLFNNGIYVRFINMCPTLGTVVSSSGTLTVDVADTDSVIIAAKIAVSATHVVAAAGDELLKSPFTGLVLRRASSWPVAMRAAQVEASQNLGFVGLGGVAGIIYLFRDENATNALDAAGFTTLRKFPGFPGFYITSAYTCTVSTSDYYPFTNARVIDRGCGIARTNTLPLVNSKVPTTTRDGNPGVIKELKAQQIEAALNSALLTGLVDTSPQDAVAAGSTVNRTHNILADGNMIIAVAIQPFAYARLITVNIGMAVAV